MKLKIKETTKKEIEVKFPLYLKYGFLTMIIDENTYIDVSSDADEIKVIENDPAMVKWAIEKGEPIPKEEFITAFKKAQDRINNILPELSAPTLERSY